MLRFVSGAPETTCEFAELVRAASDAEFREIEFEVGRKEFEREPSVIGFLEIGLRRFDEAGLLSGAHRAFSVCSCDIPKLGRDCLPKQADNPDGTHRLRR